MTEKLFECFSIEDIPKKEEPKKENMNTMFNIFPDVFRELGGYTREEMAEMQREDKAQRERERLRYWHQRCKEQGL